METPLDALAAILANEFPSTARAFAAEIIAELNQRGFVIVSVRDHMHPAERDR